VFRRLYADDGLILFALVFLLVNSIVVQVGADGVYESVAVASGQLYPLPADFPRTAEKLARKEIATGIFFYSGLWSVKFSFLVFFKRLGEGVRHQNKVWWA
ncbi:MAG: hypothetical protein M1835_001816, partial [Candelina submexicana]